MLRRTICTNETDYEPRVERLQACIKKQQVQQTTVDSVQARIASILEQYGSYVDQLSRVFVALDTTIHRLEQSRATKLSTGVTATAVATANHL